MPPRRSTLSLNQKLTLIIASLAVIAGIIAAFISGHDWFSSSPSDPSSINTITVSPTNTASLQIIPTNTIPPTVTSSPTPNPTLIALYESAEAANSSFKPEVRIINNIEQIRVPEGSFVAGDISGIGYDDEKPFHLVYTDGFWIDRNLVTNSQYNECPDITCTSPQETDSHKRPNGYFGVPAYKDYPVINVTWQQSSDFCNWRGGRLPTEAEFEKAAGWNPATGVTYIYPWGDFSPTSQLANYDGVDRDTTPVGSYPQGMSPIGAYDMAGNVWEWVSDWYSETYYRDNQEWSNPTGPEIGVEKVVKGGSWYTTNTSWLRIANRGKSIPDKVANEFGFRCVFEE